MDDPKSQNKTDEAPDTGGRQPWQPLDFEKIAASDAEGATAVPGTFDGTTYS